jgi:hypothetical protein
MKIIKCNSSKIEKIKNFLIDYFGNDDWHDFVDSQEIGDCQAIASIISHQFSFAKKIFGEIEIDNFYFDDNGDSQNLVTHYWLEIDDVWYNSSKGTLSGYIEFDSIYDPEIQVN